MIQVTAMKRSAGCPAPGAARPAALKRFLRLGVSILAVLILLNGCEPLVKPMPQQPLLRLEKEDYPHFQDDLDYEGMHGGIQDSLAWLRKQPLDRGIAFGADAYTVGHLIRSLEAFDSLIRQRPDSEALNAALRERFRVYQAAGRDADRSVLFTGYFEPLLPGSRLPGPGFDVPVFSRPSDLVEIDLSAFAPELAGRRIVGRYTGNSVVPYPDRAQLKKRPDLARIAPPIAWLRDEIDLFILQIQGSGRIALADGQVLFVRYDGSNGLPYRSIGRLLIDQGKVKADGLTMQSIREYLQKNPEEAEAIMNHNPRYIFFKQADAGPFGALGQPLTPLRSIAVDRGLFPSAALAFITTRVPDVDSGGTIRQWRDHSSFALAHDAGAAIQGSGRVDLFWGHGPQAETAAGHMKNNGRLFFLVLKAQ